MTEIPARGRVVHTGQAVVDLVMQISALPVTGSDVFARSATFTAGGGFNVMAAAARDGAKVVYVGGHGSGPFGDIVRAAMTSVGVQVMSAQHPSMDTGFSVALVDDEAERTFISSLGAEGHVVIDDYRAVELTSGDVVYVSGYSLLHTANRAALVAWLPTVPDGVVVVVDPSPLVAEIPSDALAIVCGRADIWSTNRSEAGLLIREPNLVVTDLAGRLRDHVDCTVVLRDGHDGCWIAPRDPLAPLLHIPGAPVQALDTNGAGDTHTGVLAAEVALGNDIEGAARRANIAAAISVTRHGPATSPERSEIDLALADRGAELGFVAPGLSGSSAR
jgi:sugar/nucleoside kinase (ribokinase family)